MLCVSIFCFGSSTGPFVDVHYLTELRLLSFCLPSVSLISVSYYICPTSTVTVPDVCLSPLIVMSDALLHSLNTTASKVKNI
jgi:hypothetical protein